MWHGRECARSGGSRYRWAFCRIWFAGSRGTLATDTLRAPRLRAGTSSTDVIRCSNPIRSALLSLVVACLQIHRIYRMWIPLDFLLMLLRSLRENERERERVASRAVYHKKIIVIGKKITDWLQPS